MGIADKAAQSAAADPGADPSAGETFTKPDISSAVPPEMQDAVARITAAGMKLMYSPQMRDKLKEAVNSPDPTPKVLAENVTGLLLIMDRQAGKSGLPGPALMPAAVELLGDAGDAMVKAGRPVSQDDFKTAIQMTFVLMSKKMGMNDAQIMDTANKALPPDQQVAGGAPPDGPAADAAQAADSADPAAAVPPGPEGAAPVDPNAPPAGATPGAAPPGPPIPPDDPNQP